MISHRACLEEFTKLASDFSLWKSVPTSSNRKVSVPDRLPYLSRVPSNPDVLKKYILDKLRSPKGKSYKYLGYPTVAMDAKNVLPKLEELGATATRLAVPMPGNRPFSKSWRVGSLHVHKLGPILLAHEDKITPSGVLSSISHGVKEGIPAVVKRIRVKDRLVKEGVGEVKPPEAPKQEDSPFKRWLRTQGRIALEDGIYEAAEVAARNMSRGKVPVGRVAAYLAR